MIYAEGCPSESFHPGEFTKEGISGASYKSLIALFPNLKNNPESYGKAAYTSLKSNEALLLADKLYLEPNQNTPKHMPSEAPLQHVQQH